MMALEPGVHFVAAETEGLILAQFLTGFVAQIETWSP